MSLVFQESYSKVRDRKRKMNFSQVQKLAILDYGSHSRNKKNLAFVGKRREPRPENCPLMSTLVSCLVCACINTHTHTCFMSHVCLYKPTHTHTHHIHLHKNKYVLKIFTGIKLIYKFHREKYVLCLLSYIT